MLIGNFFHKVNPKYKRHNFSDLCFNSVSCKKGSIFFAIKGNKFDGNKYIEKAILNGAKTIISNKKFEGFKKKILYLNSKNVRKTLSKINYRIFKQRPKNLIAVTGTNGKSSVADFYFQILKFNNKRAASIGTLGIQTVNTKTKVANTTLNPIELGSCLERLKKRKIVVSGTAKLANVDGYEIGGKTGTANKTINGVYTNKKINTFASVFPTSKPQFVFVVLIDEPQINNSYIYEYRDGSGFKLKGTPRPTAGWTSVEVAGKIIEKIGPILATKYIEIN